MAHTMVFIYLKGFELGKELDFLRVDSILELE
jgi:hypothetical protein